MIAADPGSTAKPIRLFVAVDLPAVVTDGLVRRFEPIHGSVPGARWTRPSGWHVTLKFLGSTGAEILPAIGASVRSVASATEPFVTRLSRIGAFPAASRARVLWAGLDDGDGRFAQMVKQLDELLVEWFEPERRAFAPHLTLARIDPPARLAPDVLGLDMTSEPFAVDRVTLYRSHLSPKGAAYEAMAVAALGVQTADDA